MLKKNKIKRLLRKKLGNYFYKHLFNGITEDDLLVYNPKNKSFSICNQEIHINQFQALRSQARNLKDLPLWKFLTKECKYRANEVMYLNSKTEDDLYFGKAMLKCVEIMENKLKQIENIK